MTARCSTPTTINSFLWAVENQEYEQCQRMLREGLVNVDVRTTHGLTPLMLAASRGFLDILRLLLDHRAEVDLRDPDGWTAQVRVF